MTLAGTRGLDGAAVQFDDGLCDRQTETEPAMRPRGAAVGLPETIEHVGHERRRNPLTGIADGHLDVTVAGLERELDASFRRRELDGVRQQVPDHLLDAVRICNAQDRPAVVVGLELNLLGVGSAAHDVEGRVGQLGQVDGRRLKTELARHDPRDIEQVVDQLRLRAGVARDRGKRATDFFTRQLPAFNEADPSEHGVEWRAELV